MWMSERAVAQRLTHDSRHQLDDRCLIVEADLVERFLTGLIRGFGVRERRDEPTDVGVGAPQLLGVRRDRLRVGGQPGELLARCRLCRVTLDLRTIGAPDRELAARFGDRDEEELAGDALFDVLGELGADRCRLRIGDRQTTRLPEGRRVLGAADAVLGEHHVAEAPELALAVVECLGEFFAGHMTHLDERLPESDAFLDARAQTVFDRDRAGAARGIGSPLVVFALSQCHVAQLPSASVGSVWYVGAAASIGTRH